MKLKQSKVLFNEDKHEYWLGKKQLQGITPVINWLYDKTYEGISQKTLDDAKARGKHIHQLCQWYDETGAVSDEEQLQDYIGFTENLTHIASEYLVSDEKHFASAIDKIYQGEEGVILGDIKCTSELHEENVTAQLSIYAMLFEQMNPKVKVEKLIAIWLPKPMYGKGKIIECKRIPVHICKEILDTFINSPWEVDEIRAKINENTLPAVSEFVIQQFRDVEQKLADFEKKASYYKEAAENIRSGLLSLMQENDVKKWEGERIILTRKLASKRQTLDSKKVKELYPDVYDECVKESTTSESLLIKIK